MSLIRSLFRGRSNSGGKDPQMGDENTATPPADQGGQVNQDVIAQVVAAAVAKALPAAIAEANKPIVEALAKLQGAAPQQSQPQAAAAQTQPVTLDAIQQLLEKKLSDHQQSAQLKARREAYQTEKLKDLPPVYRNLLGNDPDKWAAEEQEIRKQFRADLSSAGIQVPNVAGTADTPGDAKLPNTADLSKLSPVQLIEAGLKKSTASSGKPKPSAAEQQAAS